VDWLIGRLGKLSFQWKETLFSSNCSPKGVGFLLNS
jgi:hypothetical protein